MSSWHDEVPATIKVPDREELLEDLLEISTDLDLSEHLYPFLLNGLAGRKVLKSTLWVKIRIIVIKRCAGIPVGIQNKLRTAAPYLVSAFTQDTALLERTEKDLTQALKLPSV